MHCLINKGLGIVFTGRFLQSPTRNEFVIRQMQMDRSTIQFVLTNVCFAVQNCSASISLNGSLQAESKKSFST